MKKNIIRVLVLILALIVTVFLFSCGKDKTDGGDNTEETENVSDNEETTANTDSESAENGDLTDDSDGEKAEDGTDTTDTPDETEYDTVVLDDGTVLYFPKFTDDIARLIMNMSETDEPSDTLPVPDDWEPIETEIDFFD